MNDIPSVACPSCGKAVQWTPQASYRPFCSERCYQLDLGDWLSANHRIAGPAIDPMAPSLDEADEN